MYNRDTVDAANLTCPGYVNFPGEKLECDCLLGKVTL